MFVFFLIATAFAVNGPYDLHGYVVRSDHKPNDNPYTNINGDWLNLVRGTGQVDRTKTGGIYRA